MRAYGFHHDRPMHPAPSYLYTSQGPAEVDESSGADMTSSHHKRGPWSQAEDHQLMTLVQHQGALNWVRIAQFLGSRTPKQCRERYHQNLKPSLNHEPISPEEGAQIERMVHEMGKRWAEIARRLHNRSDNAVKNWWNGSQNRRKRDGRRKSYHHAGGSTHQPHHIVHPSQQQQPQQHPSSVDSVHSHHHHHHNHGSHHAHDAHAHHRILSAPYEHAPIPESYPSFAANPRVGPLPVRSLTIPRTLPPLTRSSMSAPRPLSPSFGHGRHQYDTPLPSPSALSPGADSVDGAPSLMSDNGSSYSTSPRAPHRDLGSPIDLPPLKNFTTTATPNAVSSIRRSSRSSHHEYLHHPYQRPGSLSPADVKLPGFSSLAMAGAKGHEYSSGSSSRRESSCYSPRTHHSQLPTAPSSPINNLPALRMPPASSTAQPHHKPTTGRDRLGISSLLS